MEAMPQVSAWPFVFECTLTPVPKGRPRFGKYGVRTPPETVAFERSVGILLRQAWGRREILSGPVSVELCFRIARTRGPMARGKLFAFCKPVADLDNLIKSVTDAANGIAWDDDVRICAISARKIFVDSQPGFTLRVSPLDTG